MRRPVQQYCFNTADSAADARFAWQAKKISEMEAELEKRVAALEAKTEEYKTWLARRDEFSRGRRRSWSRSTRRCVPMRRRCSSPAMDEETAAAVLTKLETKVGERSHERDGSGNGGEHRGDHLGRGEDTAEPQAAPPARSRTARHRPAARRTAARQRLKAGRRS